MLHAILDETAPVAFAHRGGARLFPENTLVAFERAFAMGCPTLELDLRLTRDAELVVLHDPTMERTTDGCGEVASLRLDELQRLDAGYWFTLDGSTHPERGRGARVPSFDEVVSALPGAAFNVELKVPGAADPLIRIIRRYALEQRIIVAAHRHDIIRDFRRRAPHIATSASRREAALFLALSMLGGKFAKPRYRAFQVPLRFRGVRIVTPRFVDLAHQMGVAVHVWTIDDPDVMCSLLAQRVDGIMTDRPDLLLAELGVSR